MKRFFLTLAVAIATTITANAENYDFLAIQKMDGTVVSFNSTDLTITFADGNLIASQGGQQTTLELSKLSKMFFSSTTDVQNLSTDAVETGDVFDLQGRRIASKIRLKDLQNQLPKGVYLVKNGQKAVKMTVK